LDINCIRADFSKYIEPYSNFRTFHEEIGAILQAKGWGSAVFKELTGLDDMTFTRLKTKPDYQFSKRVIVTLIIALILDIGTAERLLQLQGYALSPTNQVDMLYRFFIERGFEDIEACNQFLSALKVPVKHHLGSRSK
jgi:hypothetical protein